MFPKGLIVSSQALEGNPMKSTEKLASMAEAAAKGGACALRVDGADMVKELKERTDVPIIAINKIKDKSGRTVITPCFEMAKELALASADIIALDATFYPSELKDDLATLIKRIHEELGILVMADISTVEEAVNASRLGADAVSTTLAGYVPGHFTRAMSSTFQITVLLKKLPTKSLTRFWLPRDVSGLPMPS